MHQEVANFGSWDSRNDRWLHTQARLAPGVERGRAQVAVDVVARQLEEAYPDQNREVRLRVLPLWKSPYGGQAVFLPVLSVLMAVSGAVLLIVTANVANLLLARAAGTGEGDCDPAGAGWGAGAVAAATADGESVAGAVGRRVGSVLASWAAGSLLALMPPTHLPVGYSFGLDGRTLMVTLG
jgi:hypothetical protein